MARKKKNRYYVRPDGLHEAFRVFNGKRIPFRGRTDQEVDDKIEAYKAKLKNGRTWDEVEAAWEAEHFPEIKTGTQECYSGAIRRACEGFGALPIHTLTPMDFDALLKAMKAQGFRKQTVAVQKSFMKQVCAYAVLHGDIQISPMQEVQLPKGLKSGTRDPAPEAAEHAAAGTVKDKADLFAKVLYFTGPRRGEALAITGEDIDRENCRIRICKKVIFRNGKPILEDHTKTEAGMRVILVPTSLLEDIPEKLTGPLFPGSGENGYMLEKEFNAMWLRWCRRHGFIRKVEMSTGKKGPDGKIGRRIVECPSVTPHQFRHSYATLLFDADIDSKDAAQILGHSKEEVTREIYTHIRKSRQSKTAQKINDYISSL